MQQRKFCLALFLFVVHIVGAQEIRFQNNVKGGLAIATNGFNISDALPFNVSGGNFMSTSSDLVLPVNSSILKAILYVEGYSFKIDTISFKFPGSSQYVTLHDQSFGFIDNPADNNDYSQFIIDVTQMIPSDGYVSTVTAGGHSSNTGRYSVADILPFDDQNKGYGWALFVVYTNPNARYRNITIADQTVRFYPGFSTSILIEDIIVSSVSPVNAMIAATGSFGDAGPTYLDYVEFGEEGQTLVKLPDPVTLDPQDVLNSTIGFGSNINVVEDGVSGLTPGNFIARNPYNEAAGPSGSAYWYDCDLFDASGILTNDLAPKNIEIKQVSTNGDLLGVGSYGISVNISACELTKSISPSTINQGEIATYTFVLNNNVPSAINLTGIRFEDHLPDGLQIANPNCATVTGGSGAIINAIPGSNLFQLSNLSIASGDSAFVTICVTNKNQQWNTDCSNYPNSFTNGYANIKNCSNNVVNSVTNQCLQVLPFPNAKFKADPVCFGEPTIFEDTTFQHYPTFISYWEWDFGVTPTQTSNDQHPTFIYPQAGTYQVRLIVETEGMLRDTLIKNIVVNPKPEVTISGDTAICEGEPATLFFTTSGNGGFTIDINDEADGIVHNTSTDGDSLIVFPSNTTSYTITKITDSSTPTCISLKSSIATVLVNPTPTLHITAYDSICNGDSVLFELQLSGDEPFQVKYTDQNDTYTLNNIPSNYSFKLAPEQSTNYDFIQVTDNGNPAPACSINPNKRKTVTVFNKPKAVFANYLEVCENSPAKIPYQIANGSIVDWFDIYYTDLLTGNTYISEYKSLIDSLTFLETSPTGPRQLIINKMDNGYTPQRCWIIENDTINMIIQGSPEAKIMGDTTICEGEAFDITFLFPKGTPGFNVTLSSNTDTLLQNIQSGYSYQSVGVDSIFYTLKDITDNTLAKCAGSWDKDTVFVHVNPIPYASISGDNTICAGEESSIQIQTSGIAPYTFYFSTGDSTITYTSNFNTDSILVFPEVTTTYTLEQLDDGSDNTCINHNLGSVKVEVRPLPEVSIYGSTDICDGEDATIFIEAESYGPIDLTYINQNNEETNHWGIDNNLNYHLVLPVGTHSYHVISAAMQEYPYCQAAPESLTDTVRVNVFPVPLADFELKNNISCAPLEATFTHKVNENYPVDLIWNFGDGRVYNMNDSIFNITYDNGGFYDVELKVVAKQYPFCHHTKVVDNGIIVHPDPIINYKHYPNPITLDNNNVLFVNKTLFGEHFLWELYNSDSVMIDSSREESPRFIFPNETEDTYTLILQSISPEGCFAELNKTIHVEGSLLVNIPTAFTPNGDGLNDFLKPVIFGAFEDFSFEFSIYNRYGQRVFQSDTYSEVISGWNGMFNNKEAVSSSYVYKLVVRSLFSERIHEYTGEFILIR